MGRLFSVTLLAWVASAPLLTSCVTDEALETSAKELVYGADNRREVEDTGSRSKTLARSVALLVDRNQLARRGNGWRVRSSTTLADTFAVPACRGERFTRQPVAGFCTGFVVGPRLIATAGHCVSDASCGRTRFAFGYQRRNGRANGNLGRDDVYSCQRVVERRNTSTNDWAVVRVDRRIRGREPLTLRRRGKVGNNAQLFVIGHPAGLPQKFAGGARVRRNGSRNFFEASLDTYAGNSGSPVFNAQNRQVEGILVRGATDWTYGRQNGARCWRSNQCSNSRGCNGQFEEVTRIERIRGAL